MSALSQVDSSVEINRLLLVMTCITRSGGEQKSRQHLNVSLIKCKRTIKTSLEQTPSGAAFTEIPILKFLSIKYCVGENSRNRRLINQVLI